MASSPLAALVEGHDVDQFPQVALEDGDVVADEGERVVDLVGHAGDHLAEPGELLGLDQAGLGDLEVLVGPPLRLGHLAEQQVLGPQLLVGPLPLGDVGEDPLDADDPAVDVADRRLDDLDVEDPPAGGRVLLDRLQRHAGLDHGGVVVAVLGGHLGREEGEVVLAQHLARRPGPARG